jgi:hypothetical protein
MANSICEICGNNFGKDGAFMLKGNAICSSCVVDQGFIPLISPEKKMFDPNSIPREDWTCSLCKRNLKDVLEDWLEFNMSGILCNHCNSI